MLRWQSFIERLSYLTAEDVVRDPGWAESIVVSTDRRTVHSVNEVRARQFPHRGAALNTWRLAPQTKDAGHLLHATMENVYGMVKDTKTYFVKGAPATLTNNVPPEGGLSNGTRCKLHALVLAGEDSRLAVRLARAGEVIMLKRPPFAVVMALPRGGVVPLWVSDIGLGGTSEGHWSTHFRVDWRCDTLEIPCTWGRAMTIKTIIVRCSFSHVPPPTMKTPNT